MSLVIALLLQTVHVALLLAVAPLLVGLIRRLKARLVGRIGPPVLQPYRDLRRLARKQTVLAENASLLFRLAPQASFAATTAAAALIPSFALGMATAPVADLLVIAGLLTMVRVILALAAMDVGTAFGGIGASREMTFSAFAEPALLLVFLTLMLLAGTTNLDVIAGLLRDGSFGLRVSLGLALVSTLAVAVAENGRIPVDNPASHLELGMVHEAMALEYSGPDLAASRPTAAAWWPGRSAWPSGCRRCSAWRWRWQFSRRRSPRCASFACRNTLASPCCWGCWRRCSCSSARASCDAAAFQHPSLRAALAARQSRAAAGCSRPWLASSLRSSQ
jgi:formate hydrogenlyase subunit 4